MADYQMHRPGFDRRRATRGHFNSGYEVETVDSDDGIDYVDWDAARESGWPTGVELTYRIIDGKRAYFRDGVEYARGLRPALSPDAGGRDA